jgi:hypothetical protein
MWVNLVFAGTNVGLSIKLGVHRDAARRRIWRSRKPLCDDRSKAMMAVRRRKQRSISNVQNSSFFLRMDIAG